jgi:hypothetical protein
VAKVTAALAEVKQLTKMIKFGAIMTIKHDFAALKHDHAEILERLKSSPATVITIVSEVAQKQTTTELSEKLHERQASCFVDDGSTGFHFNLFSVLVSPSDSSIPL